MSLRGALATKHPDLRLRPDGLLRSARNDGCSGAGQISRSANATLAPSAIKPPAKVRRSHLITLCRVTMRSRTPAANRTYTTNTAIVIAMNAPAQLQYRIWRG